MYRARVHTQRRIPRPPHAHHRRQAILRATSRSRASDPVIISRTNGMCWRRAHKREREKSRKKSDERSRATRLQHGRACNRLAKPEMTVDFRARSPRRLALGRGRRDFYWCSFDCGRVSRQVTGSYVALHSGTRRTVAFISVVTAPTDLL